jgi:uncharacterized protein YaiL (DUF2058 family)
MSSLQDQLLKAGLIDSKQAKQAGKEKRKQKKAAKSAGRPLEDEAKLAAARARAQKQERDRALNAAREEAVREKAVAAQIRQLIERNRQPKGNGDIAHNFVFEKKIKRLYVTRAMHEQLAKGLVLIVAFEGQFELLPRAIAEKIAERDPALVISCPAGDASGEDDPYADYPIPDDLMW